jgi:tetratricopeptide (TPR) repeat protein
MRSMDKNNLSFGMKVVIVIFGVILVLSLMLPFFSSCSFGGSSSDSTQTQEEDTSSLSTVGDVDAAYQSKIGSLSASLESDSTSLLNTVNMGNAYMEWAQELESVSTSSEDDEHIKETYAAAIPYYDAYLEQEPDSKVVAMNRALCEYYSGDEEQGLADMEALAETSKDFSPVLYYLGTMYEDQGEYDLASSAYSDAITADQSDSYNLTYSALIRMSLLSQYADMSASSDSDAIDSSLRADYSYYSDFADYSLLDSSDSMSTDGMVGGITLDTSSSSQG